MVNMLGLRINYMILHAWNSFLGFSFMCLSLYMMVYYVCHKIFNLFLRVRDRPLVNDI